MKRVLIACFLITTTSLSGLSCSKVRCEEVCECVDEYFDEEDCVEDCQEEYKDSNDCKDAVKDLAECVEENDCWDDKCTSEWEKFNEDCDILLDPNQGGGASDSDADADNSDFFIGIFG